MRNNSGLYREWECANKELPLSSWEATIHQQHLLGVVGWSSSRGYSVRWILGAYTCLKNRAWLKPVCCHRKGLDLYLLKSINFKSKLSRTKENTNEIILIVTSLLTPRFPLHSQLLSTITALYSCSFPHLSSNAFLFTNLLGTVGVKYWSEFLLLHWLQLLQNRR